MKILPSAENFSEPHCHAPRTDTRHYSTAAQSLSARSWHGEGIPIGNPPETPFASKQEGRKRTPIIPLFIPFAGCPYRCIYCAQDKQTGLTTPQSPIALLESLAKILDGKNGENTGENDGLPPHFEFAFYGGTFTALPESIQLRCLEMLAPYKACGRLSRIRCSTRPDTLDPAHLLRLRKAGLDLVELGIQSFNDTALRVSSRGYDGNTALSGCRMIQDSGLALGIQLLPGMPGVTPDIFLEDACRSLELSPACLRWYPCLVVEETPLALLWRKKLYHPWDTGTTVATLGKALALAWTRRVPVIRLSLAPENELDAAVLAGPRHPALGNLIQGEALYLTLLDRLKDLPLPVEADLPSFCQGFFYGDGGALRPRWESLGLTPGRIRWIPGHEAFVRSVTPRSPGKKEQATPISNIRL